MDEAKRKRLADAGWRTGDAADFLELTAEEATFVELKLALARHLRELRTRRALTRARSPAGSARASLAWRRWRLPTPRCPSIFS